MLVKLENNMPVEWPVNENRIKSENPNVSFPRDVTKIDIAAYGYAKFSYADRPDYDPEYQECAETTPVLNGDTYVQTWEVTDKFTAEERTAYDAEKEEALLTGLAESTRSKRNQLLTESDWTQLPDAGVDANAWATYRQALRDIPEQAGFPNDVTFPDKPE